jgi:glycosyltransferase involved in cell wall biosynthesis
MNKSFKHLPQNERKKILLICDDIRVHSGVATVAKEMVINTCQHFNWVQVAGAIKHPEAGKRFDLSADTNKEAELEDSSVILYPTDGYGNPDLIRQLIKIEKPDAIFIITDPRYFTWLFNMESEIRKVMPIIYLNIWDDYPAPLYNKAYYESCDALLAISKQTKNINEIVLGDKAEDKIIKYVPHGLNTKYYFPLEKSSKEVQDIKKQVFGDDEVDFVMFFNSRNIRRKQIPDTMLAFKLFLDSLPKEQADKCRFLLHTEIVHEAGTDLGVINELLFSKDYPNAISFSTNKLPTATLNLLYNLADVQILLTSNEGWGLTLTEAILTGTPIIANVTGGMQDQMRFEYDMDEGPGVKKGEWIDFDSDFPSNHLGTYKKHGEWAFPVYPTSRSLQGSPQTPYIWDDRCTAEDACDRIKEVYNLGHEKRTEVGMKGREWALGDEAGFTSIKMSNKIIDAVDELFDTWEPREKFELINTSDDIKKVQTHALIY